MSARTRVAVIGASGRLGASACRLLEHSDEFELVARVDAHDELEQVVRASKATLAFEATRAGLGAAHGRRLLSIDVRPLIGTSGVDEDELAELDRLSRQRGLGGLVVPNFSLGMWLLQRAAEEAARHFAHAEIIELHHERKKDAPSGTSIDTAARLRNVSEQSRDVPIHSVRLPGLYAHQEVIFGAAGEVYTLRHDMHGPDAFGPGILAGLRYVARAQGVGRGLGLALARG